MNFTLEFIISLLLKDTSHKIFLDHWLEAYQNILFKVKGKLLWALAHFVWTCLDLKELCASLGCKSILYSSLRGLRNVATLRGDPLH